MLSHLRAFACDRPSASNSLLFKALLILQAPLKCQAILGPTFFLFNLTETTVVFLEKPLFRCLPSFSLIYWDQAAP